MAANSIYTGVKCAGIIIINNANRPINTVTQRVAHIVCAQAIIIAIFYNMQALSTHAQIVRAGVIVIAIGWNIEALSVCT